MKKTILRLMVLAISIAAIQSCKKGEEDPFLSLRSRKARLTGEWKLSSYSYNSYENGVLDFSESFDGTNMKEDNGDLIPYSSDYIFEKDGTFEINTVDNGITRTSKGNWAFLGKSKEAEMKNKEYFLLDETSFTSQNYSSSTSDFNSGDAIAYHLKKLSNKEVILEYVYTYSDGSDSYKEEETYILTKK
jgi:hypothetical protein